LLPAGGVAGWGLHPLESAAFARRTPTAEAAASEVAAMPAGTHEVLDQTREAVERRARILLAQLHELGDDPVKAVNKEETAIAEEECSNLR